MDEKDMQRVRDVAKHFGNQLNKRPSDGSYNLNDLNSKSKTLFNFPSFPRLLELVAWIEGGPELLARVSDLLDSKKTKPKPEPSQPALRESDMDRMNIIRDEVVKLVEDMNELVAEVRKRANEKIQV